MELKQLPGAWVLEAFRRGDVNLDELNRRLPDDVDLMLHEMDTILPDSITRLLDACADISGNQNFGLAMNNLVDLTMYGIFGYLLLNSSTVDDLFQTMVRYHSVHHNGGVLYKLDTQKDTASIQLYYAERSQLCHRHISEWGLGFVPGYLTLALGDQATPISAQFTHPSPQNLQALHAAFGPNPEFNQAHNQLIYPRAILRTRINEIDSHLLKTLRERADKQLLALNKDGSLLNQIKIILIDNIGNHKITAVDVASLLNLSISTFKRRMRKEGVSFSDIQASIKNELAKQLLSQTSIKIYEVALNTGFTSQSSFTRFFIRYNHQTPLNFRRSISTQESQH